MSEPMTDAELQKFVNLDDAMFAKFLPTVTPERRALFDRMRQVAVEAELWAAGLGPKPTGVLIDTVRDAKRRRGWRRAVFEETK